jgi:hypothetical protein
MIGHGCCCLDQLAGHRLVRALPAGGVADRKRCHPPAVFMSMRKHHHAASQSAATTPRGGRRADQPMPLVSRPSDASTPSSLSPSPVRGLYRRLGVERRPSSLLSTRARRLPARPVALGNRSCAQIMDVLPSPPWGQAQHINRPAPRLRPGRCPGWLGQPSRGRCRQRAASVRSVHGYLVCSWRGFHPGWPGRSSMAQTQEVRGVGWRDPAARPCAWGGGRRASVPA